MHNAPTTTNHHALNNDNTTPATPATPNAANAACFTASGLAAPDAVNLSGPVRSSSVPRTPSE